MYVMLYQGDREAARKSNRLLSYGNDVKSEPFLSFLDENGFCEPIEDQQGLGDIAPAKDRLREALLGIS